MGYSQSIQTLEALREQGLLEHLERGQGCVWTVGPGVSVQAFAYKIREALSIARKHPLSYPELAKASELFRIEVLGEKSVQARRAHGTTEAAIVEGAPSVSGLETVEKGTIHGAQTAESIIQYWIGQQPSNASILFPQANLSFNDKQRLYTWAGARGWIFFVAPDGALTLQPHRGDLADFAWTPSDESEEA